jgi:hypothetical protein
MEKHEQGNWENDPSVEVHKDTLKKNYFQLYM